jgi:hypothetical protein
VNLIYDEEDEKKRDNKTNSKQKYMGIIRKNRREL